MLLTFKPVREQQRYRWNKSRVACAMTTMTMEEKMNKKKKKNRNAFDGPSAERARVTRRSTLDSMFQKINVAFINLSLSHYALITNDVESVLHLYAFNAFNASILCTQSPITETIFFFFVFVFFLRWTACKEKSLFLQSRPFWWCIRRRRRRWRKVNNRINEFRYFVDHGFHFWMSNHTNIYFLLVAFVVLFSTEYSHNRAPSSFSLREPKKISKANAIMKNCF